LNHLHKVLHHLIVHATLNQQGGQNKSGMAHLGPLDESNTQELEEYPWFWGWMSREDCERRLHTEGEVGNVVVRINAMGDYIMSFW